MIKLICLCVGLFAPFDLCADATPTAATGLEDADVYYAPDVAEDNPQGVTPEAQAALPQGAYISRASVSTFDFSNGKDLKGVELFLGHDYLGRSPLVLQGQVVAPGAELAARMDGYDEGSRPNLRLPADGSVRLALLPENAAGWYTTPAWVVGLGLLAASVAVYRSDNTSPGLALVGAGVSVIALSQLTARFLHLPSLRREVEAYNARPEPAPAP